MSLFHVDEDRVLPDHWAVYDEHGRVARRLVRRGSMRTPGPAVFHSHDAAAVYCDRINEHMAGVAGGAW